MNCSTVRRTLLAQESPAPAPAEGRHLLGCAGCRAWHRRLLRIEQQLPLVAVPTCPVPPSLLDALRLPGPHGVGLAPLAGRPRNLEGGRKKLALAFSLAASLAVFTVGWWAWPQQPSLPTRSIASVSDSYLRLRDRKLAQASTAPKRAAALADLADEFFSEVRRQGDDAARVAVLARQFDRLVGEDLIHHVGLISLGERQAVALSLAEQMRRVQGEATRLAQEWKSQHPAAVASLRRMVTSARAAEGRLRRFA